MDLLGTLCPLSTPRIKAASDHRPGHASGAERRESLAQACAFSSACPKRRWTAAYFPCGHRTCDRPEQAYGIKSDQAASRGWAAGLQHRGKDTRRRRMLLQRAEPVHRLSVQRRKENTSFETSIDEVMLHFDDCYHQAIDKLIAGRQQEAYLSADE